MNTIDSRVKGMPGGMQACALEDIGSLGWNLLREDLPLPAAVLKASALQHNSDWMRRFLRAGHSLFAPHGKTSMSPQLFEMQIEDGAWGLTLATCHQVQVARHFGFGRILLANQLVGKQAIAYVIEELRRDPEFDFYCLVDSVPLVETLARAVRESGMGRPLQVLLEMGCQGGRTGCRSFEQAMQVAQAVAQAAPHLTLRGVEGFEGLIPPAPDLSPEPAGAPVSRRHGPGRRGLRCGSAIRPRRRDPERRRLGLLRLGRDRFPPGEAVATSRHRDAQRLLPDA